MKISLNREVCVLNGKSLTGQGPDSTNTHRVTRPIPAELLLLWQRFQEQAISQPEWTHQAHLKVAIAATRLHGVEAVSLLREGIQKLNARLAIEQMV